MTMVSVAANYALIIDTLARRVQIRARSGRPLMDEALGFTTDGRDPRRDGTTPPRRAATTPLHHPTRATTKQALAL